MVLLKKQRFQFPIVRIDDRLIHGQVVLGWVEPLKIRSLILAHDTIAHDQDLKTAIAGILPSHLDFQVLSLKDTAAILNDSQKNKRQMVVVESPKAMKIIVANGGKIDNIIIGGLHHQEDRTELLPYVFLSPADISQMNEIVKSGISVTCQDLPGSSPVSWDNIMQKLDNR